MDIISAKHQRVSPHITDVPVDSLHNDLTILDQQTLTDTPSLLFFTEPNDAGIMGVSLGSIDSRSVHLTETMRADGWFIQIC